MKRGISVVTSIYLLLFAMGSMFAQQPNPATPTMAQVAIVGEVKADYRFLTLKDQRSVKDVLKPEYLGPSPDTLHMTLYHMQTATTEPITLTSRLSERTSKTACFGVQEANMAHKTD